MYLLVEVFEPQVSVAVDCLADSSPFSESGPEWTRESFQGVQEKPICGK